VFTELAEDDSGKTTWSRVLLVDFIGPLKKKVSEFGSIFKHLNFKNIKYWK